MGKYDRHIARERAGHGPGARARTHLNPPGRRFSNGSRKIPTPLPKICLRVCRKACPALSRQGNCELSNAESNSGVVKSHASCCSVLTRRQKWNGMCASLVPPSTPTRSAHDHRLDLKSIKVQAGNRTAPSFAQPGLWSFLDGLAEKSRPVFMRGDCHWGTENAMTGAEERNIGYLFKLKQSAHVKKLIGQIFDKEEWVEAGQQWKGRVDELRLSGWTKARRVIVLRRPLPNKPASEAEAAGKKKSRGKAAKQLSLDLPEVIGD